MADEDGMDYSAAAAASSATVEPSSEFTSLIDYYLMNQLYRHVQMACEQVIGRGSAMDEEARFWRAVALTVEGAATEAIRELEPLQDNPQLALAVNAALIQAHKTAKGAKDKESLERLKEKLKKLSRDADDSGLIFAGRYFFHTDKAKQARQCLEKIYSSRPNDVTTLVLLGWLALQSQQSRTVRQSVAFFEQALKLTDKREIGALLGRSKYYERSIKSAAATAAAGAADSSAVAAATAANRKKWDAVLADLNQIIVLWPSFLPALVEKARVLCVMGLWEEALLTAQRVLKTDRQNVGALRIVVLYHLTRDSSASLSNARASPVQSRINDLIEALDATEPRNAALAVESAQLISRLCSRQRPILQQCLLLVERACKIEADNSAYLTELGVQHLLLEDLSQSSLCFQEASKLDEANVHALTGLIKTKILQQNYKDAQQELDFLAEISASIGSNADLTFLHALLAWLKDANESECMSHLNACTSEHSAAVASTPLGLQYFIVYNPDFVVEVAAQYMAHSGTVPLSSSDPPSSSLNQCVNLLSELVTLVPGMTTAHLMLARALFVAGRFSDAEGALATVLRLDPTAAHAHIIQAQIHLQRENFQACSGSLEQARSLDFEVRNTPVYHLLKTKLLEASGQMDDALKVLNAAMELSGVRRAVGGGAGGRGQQQQQQQQQQRQAYVHPCSASAAAVMKSTVPLQDRISIWLELAIVQARLGLEKEAARSIADARTEFKNTQESARVILAEADMCVRRKDVDAALALLKTVPTDNHYSTRARLKAAQIQLDHKRNRRAYAAIYRELAEAQQSAHYYLLLGEALMRIQEPEAAIEAYEQALKKDPADAQLQSRIGQALVATHDYARAVRYYEAAAAGGGGGGGGGGKDGVPSTVATLSTSARILLLHDLAQLYLSLKQHDQCVRVLETALSFGAEKKREGGYEDDVSLMGADVRSLSLLADVGESAKDGKMIVDSLTAAWNLQVEVLSKLGSSDSGGGSTAESRRAAKETCAQLCYRLAEYYRSPLSSQLDKAVHYYNEALRYYEGHEKSRLALARLHLLNNDLEACQQQCVTLMRIDPANKEASLMLADLMFRKNEHEAATYHFQQLLERNPERYDALDKLIQLLRRAGKLTEAPRFIKLAEKNSSNQQAPGLNYCKGLLSWYTNDPTSALASFNQCRKDGEWGRAATVNMIEIYLNPDNADLFASEAAEAKGDNSEHLASAERLLNDLRAFNDPDYTLRAHVLEAYIAMAGKNKAKIDGALNNLMSLCSTDATRDYVPALLAMANAFVLKSEPAKARNQLKRISKMKYDPDYSTDFERSWLMLADIYITVGKYEFAQELCKKCLSINKSSAKSWEMLGQIMEKEQAYKDAAEHYEQAWLFMNETSPTVGYKLAFNYLKAKRYVEAIDVCHKVLAAYPDYPKIKKDILAKAREALRP